MGRQQPGDRHCLVRAGRKRLGMLSAFLADAEEQWAFLGHWTWSGGENAFVRDGKRR